MPGKKKEAGMDRISRLRRYIEGEAEPDLFSSDYVNKAPWHRERIQPDSVFSSWRIKVEDIVEGKDKIAVRWKLRGKWTRPFAGIKPTNKMAEISGINIYRFVGDKIVESIGEFNVAGLAVQALAEGASLESCQEALTTVSLPPESRSLGGLAE